MGDNSNQDLPQFADHPRHWSSNRYVYPVISRRSQGLSIGLNISPTGVCTFRCIYCQIDRTQPTDPDPVDLALLRAELSATIDEAASGRLFTDPIFAGMPARFRRINDIALSGDGEPTASPVFRQAVGIAADCKRDSGLGETKIVLITNASGLADPEVVAALSVLDENQGQIWAKLDAGTEAYFKQINRSGCTLDEIVGNIIQTAKRRPIVIQSLFLNMQDVPPSSAELDAYIDRLRQIISAGGQIDHVQVYTVARPPAESYVTALTRAEVDAIVNLVQTRTGLTARPYYGSA